MKVLVFSGHKKWVKSLSLNRHLLLRCIASIGKLILFASHLQLNGYRCVLFVPRCLPFSEWNTVFLSEQSLSARHTFMCSINECHVSQRPIYSRAVPLSIVRILVPFPYSCRSRFIL